MSEKNTKYPSRKLPTRIMLSIRIILGGYLMYLAYGLRESFVLPIAKENIIFIIAAVAFVIVGILIIFFSISDLKNGKFQGGEMDAEVLADDAVKHIEDLDKPIDDNVQNDSSENPAAASSNIAVDSSDPYDPHNVVFKKKRDSET